MRRAECLLCGKKRTAPVPGWNTSRGITSEGKPWPTAGALTFCSACGLTQKNTGLLWRRQTARIYKTYAPYYQSGGKEQRVFDTGRGSLTTRSAALLGRLRRHLPGSAAAEALDIGCGNGSLLRNLRRSFPSWNLYGADRTRRYDRELRTRWGVRRVYHGEAANINRTFDAVFMLHVLEHARRPVAFLNSVKKLIKPGGMLFIQIPDLTANPVDLVIFDHCTHWTRSHITALLAQSGWHIRVITNRWVPREISIIAAPAPTSQARGRVPGAARHSKRLHQQIAWLGRLKAQAQALCGKGPLGIFGTSNAGTWLATEIGRGVEFFVDEDADRIGKRHLRKLIVGPHDLKRGQNVLMALPPPLASRIARRLKASGVKARLIQPPPV
ncbi:MAG: class I SAM-dependent methyltransferase [Candidatus Omnitrophica bacterium]|nr:class I SAM-dependent methyltransferase [Candidatus Omnitrophota bacterium]